MKTDTKTTPNSPQTLGDLPKRLQHYITRSDDLRSIESLLVDPSSSSMALISGLGGCGKTQLANHYLQRVIENNTYELIAWFSASDSMVHHSAFTCLAKHLGHQPTENPDKEFPKYIDSLSKKHKKSLLVFDDAGDLAVFETALNTHPYPENVHIIITSRQHSRIIPQIELSVFSEIECNQYVKSCFPLANDQDINNLGAALGYLPLALCQAVSYMQMTSESINGYLSLYQEQAKYQQHLLDVSIEGYHQTIWTTWDVSIACVIKSSHLALKILRLCYYLYGEKIPRSLLTTVCKDRIALNEAINILIRYSIITVSQDGSYLSIHSLVQVIMGMKFQLDIFDVDENNETLHTLLEALTQELNFDFNFDNKDWNLASILIPNVMSALQHALSKKIYSFNVYRLLHQVGLYQYYALIQPNQAQKSLLIALTVIKNLPEPCKLSIATLQSDLAVNSICIPCFSLANKYYTPAVNFFHTHSININEPEIARAICNLCYVYSRTEAYSSISRYTQSLNNFQLLELIDHNFQHSLSEYLTKRPEDIDTMLKLQRNLYKTLSQHYGATHFFVARQHYNLALLYKRIHDYERAGHHCDLALKLYERCWGNSAIETLYVLRLSSLIDFRMNALEPALQKAKHVMLITEEHHRSNIISHGFSLFHYGAQLCETGDIEQGCFHLRKASAAFNEYSKQNSTCVCVLINLVEYGYPKALETVFSKDICLITEHDANGNTALLAAAFHQRVDMIDLLMENSSSLNERNNFGLTPALWAAYSGNQNFLQHLLLQVDKKTWATILGQTDVDHNNLLTLSVMNNHQNMSEYLIDEHKQIQQIDSINDYGYSPLFLAQFYGFNDITKKLLTHSTRKNPSDLFGCSPMQLTRIYRAIYSEAKQEFQQLINSFSGICFCGMTGYQLTEQQLIFVVNSIEELPNIKHIIFAHQKFQKTTIKAIARFISHSKTLEKIDLRIHFTSEQEGKIANNGAKLLIDVYEQSESLHQLSLRNHAINNDMIERLQMLNQIKKTKRESEKKQKSSVFEIYYNGQTIVVPKREAQCLLHLADGLSAKQTASKLFLSQRTVELYLDKLKKRFACRTKLELLSIIPPSEIENLRTLLF